MASSGYMYGTARALLVHPFLLLSFFFFLALAPPYANGTNPPVFYRRVGKAPREGPDPLPPKKRLALCRGDGAAWQEVSRPWFERPPPGFLLPLYTQIEGPGGEGAERHRHSCRRRRRITAVRVVSPGVHAEGSSHELVLHAAMPPRSWIRLPPSFAFEIPSRGAS